MICSALKFAHLDGVFVGRTNLEFGHVFLLLNCKLITYCSLSVGGMMSLSVKSKTEDSVKCEVVDGGELKSRRHLNVRGKSATLPSITGQIHLSFSIC